MLTFRRHYRASPEEIRAAVTEPARLAGWFGEIGGAPRESGDRFTVRLSEAPNDLATGQVLRCEEALISVSWSWQGEPASEITARVDPISVEETALVITHALSERLHVVGYGEGWEQLMDALAGSLGADGPQGPVAPGAHQVEREAAAHWRRMVGDPVEVERRFDAPLERVWSAFASADGLSAWWWSHWPDVRIDAEVQVGGRYRIAAPTAGIVLCGRYLVVEERTRLAFTWEWVDAEGTSVDEAVDIRFRDDEGARQVTIRHTGPWPDDTQAGAYREGWTSTLTSLATCLREPGR